MANPVQRGLEFFKDNLLTGSGSVLGLPGAVTPKQSKAVTGALPSVGDAVDAATGFAGGVADLVKWLSYRHNWFRIAEVTLGGALVLVAIGTLAGESRAGAAVATVAKVVPK